MLISAGCTQMTYDRVRIGMTPGEYDRVLDLNQTGRTQRGLVQYSKDRNGREESLLLMFADDRRIAAKMHVVKSGEETGWSRNFRGYELQGVVDLGLIGAAEAGPIDTLRLVTQQLCELPTERNAKRGQLLALAGLARVLQQQPAIQDVGLPEFPVADLTGIAPSGGQGRLERGASGTLHVDYRVGQEP